jgi:p24 family protein alpha
MQEIFDNDHLVVSQKGSASGRFTFTAAESGDHMICFTPSSTSGKSSWLSMHSPNGGIKLTLDLAIGETSDIESSDKEKLEDIASRVKDLNHRLNDIRREQIFQRVSYLLPG